jgi:hypothetical protein
MLNLYLLLFSMSNKFLRLVISILFHLIFSLILIYFSIEQVECHYSYNDRIYVVDSLEDSATKDFNSWLVHTNCLPDHLGLAQWQIDAYTNTGIPVYSPEEEHELYISQCNLQSIEWSILITRHPEMVTPGYSCYTRYSLDNPRNPYDTLTEFLGTYCI